MSEENVGTGAYPEPWDSEVEATDGWSGSETSRERAVRDALEGIASKRRSAVLRIIGESGEYGLIWTEVGDILGIHHGQASGVLSALHKENRIARLEDRRNRCHIYVLNEFVGGRLTQRQGPPKRSSILVGDDD